MTDDKTSAPAPEGEQSAAEVDGGATAAQGDRASRLLVYSDDVHQAEITYEVVEHDGGWAYRVGETWSETFASRGEAVDAAARASAEHVQPGPDEFIEYQDEGGVWHSEQASGGDRPYTRVEDVNPVDAIRHEVQASETERMSAVIRGRPLLAVAAAAAIGFILGSR